MRAHRAERRRRAEGALAHLLLVVVLALGVFLMHAVGHPEGAGGGKASGSSTAAHHSAAPQGDDGAGHEPGPSTDMTTLCVAVLAGWLFAGLLRAGLGRRADWLALLVARLLPARAPHAPPPRPPDLALLSVLRI
ncbi:DUF6153 family protein [Streptomyces sp. NPDC047972]|uniref:DUF6153 family protein n=1 Tax=Streptomyces sp. NPDC047972 TaxID=3365493 RepID=UPI00371F2C49